MRRTFEEIEQFKEKIRLHYPNHKNVVTDGILEIDSYNNVSSKILWVLKEPYGNGGFDYSEYTAGFEYQQSFPTSSRMWHNIIHTSYGILNNMFWDNMDNCWESEEVFSTLKKIALINLKKIPGGAKSNYNEISQYFKTFSKALINDQIEFINPDIIICGGTFNPLYNDINLKLVKEYSSATVYSHSNRIIIKTYHPSYIMDQEEYCDSIIKCVVDSNFLIH